MKTDRYIKYFFTHLKYFRFNRIANFGYFIIIMLFYTFGHEIKVIL